MYYIYIILIDGYCFCFVTDNKLGCLAFNLV